MANASPADRHPRGLSRLPEGLCIRTADVHVLVATAPDDPEALGRAMGCLSDDERAIASRFRRCADAASYASGRALMRLSLGRLLDRSPRELTFDRWCERCRSANGKPRLVDPHCRLDFSLSHAGEQLLLAVARKRVGVDVEPMDRQIEPDTAGLVLAPDERADLETLAPQQRAAAIVACWMRKEAVLKALGHGLAIDPASVSVTFLENGEVRVRSLPSEFGPPQSWVLFALTGAGWAGAAAAEGGAQLTVWDAQHLLDEAR
jgi:4'-phosphopantetheinyl transferase